MKMTGVSEFRCCMIADVVRKEEKQIISAAAKCGIDLRVQLVDDLTVFNCCEHPQDVERNRMVLLRTAGFFAGLQVCGLLESRGYNIVNSRADIELFGQKTLTDTWLDSLGFPVIPSIVCFSEAGAIRASTSLGFPLVMKPSIGGFGRFVHWVENARELTQLVEHVMTFSPKHHHVMFLQKALRVTRDIRVLLLNGEVLAAVRRDSDANWAKNIALGATASPYQLTRTEASVIHRLAARRPRGFFGVDILVDAEGSPYICEVNAVCRFSGAADATGIDIAAELVNSLVAQGKVREWDTSI